MLDQVCCIIDVDGFSIQRTNNTYNLSYRNEFLVRELGYVRVDPAYVYLPRSYRFDLSGTIDFSKCTAEMERTLCFQNKVIGLGLLPGSQETDVLDLKLLPEVIRKVYDRCKRKDATVVAFKGGHREADLLVDFVPCVDLQSFGCPSFERLLDSTGLQYKDCGHHRTVPGRVIHCPMAEVAAYRDWFMINVGKYSRGGYETCAGLSPDCCCADCYDSSE